MPDSPIAIRASDETRALFNELSERSEFENKGDFLNRLLVQYQTETMKDNVSMLKPAIEAVEVLTTRLFEVLTGAGAVITTADEKHKQAIEKQRASFEETRSLLQQHITLLETERIESEERSALLIAERETAEGKAAELQQQIERLESTVTDKSALVDEYKSKNDTLSGIVSEFRGAAAENKQLKETVNNLTQVNNSLQREIDELKREQQRQAADAIAAEESLMNNLLLQKDTAVLEVKQELQLKVEELREKHAAAIDGYETKVRNLLDLLEHGRSAALAEKRPSRRPQLGTEPPSP